MVRLTNIVHLKAAFSRCLELFQDGGPREVYRGIRDYVKYDFGEDYQDRRVDNDQRWKFISSYIDEEDQLLLDIGCAEGELAARAAEMELDVIGFDRNVMRLKTAQRKHGNNSNLEFKRAELSPETVGDLPEADVILFLTVHHHWVRAYGWNDAAMMFRTLLAKTGTLIYEPPGHNPINNSTVDADLDPDDSVSYYTNLLKSEFDDSADIVDVMMTEYTDHSGRRDPIFVLESTLN